MRRFKSDRAAKIILVALLPLLLSGGACVTASVGMATSNIPLEGKEYRVLVIDDEAYVREFFLEVAQDEGWRVVAVDGARGALETLDSSAFDLLIVDLMLPRVNGIAFLEEARRRGCGTPAALMTGSPNAQAAMAAVRLGVVDFLLKPFSMHRLFEMVQGICQDRAAPLATRLRESIQESAGKMDKEELQSELAKVRLFLDLIQTEIDSL